MPISTRVYIYFVNAAGVLAAGYALSSLATPYDPVRFATYLLLALLASALKLRLPGLTGTMSIGFVFVLLGIVELSLPETMVIACAGIVLQCYWRALRRPSWIQVSFNLASVAISVVLAYECAHFVAAMHTDLVAIPMAVATCVYFTVNSLLVSGVLSFIQALPMRKVWERCYLLACPYHLLGGLIAGLVAASSRQLGWQAPLLILPVMALAYVFYRMCLVRVAAVIAV
jgi:hypothetical protein